MQVKMTSLLVWRLIVLLVGLSLVVVSIGLLFVVGVNLPDSAFGLFYVVISLTLSAACIAYFSRSQAFFRAFMLILGLVLLLMSATSFVIASRQVPEFGDNLAYEVVATFIGVGCIAFFLRTPGR
jgi:hypothetical protein